MKITKVSLLPCLVSFCVAILILVSCSGGGGWEVDYHCTYVSTTTSAGEETTVHHKTYSSKEDAETVTALQFCQRLYGKALKDAVRADVSPPVSTEEPPF